MWVSRMTMGAGNLHGLSTEPFRLGRETFGGQCLDVSRSRLKPSRNWSRSAFPVRGEALNNREVFVKYQVRSRRSASAPDIA